MFRRLMAVAAALFLLSPAAMAREREVAQVEAWPIKQTVSLGEQIWRQDMAAARATDVLLAKSAGRPPEGLIGWIVVDEGQSQRVRFLAGEESAPRAFFDVVVDRKFRPGEALAATTALSADEVAHFRARTTAARNIGSLRCAARYNTVVLRDPDGDGWLVWLLAATTKAGRVPMGGHYRFHISADGGTVEKREQLSSGCLDLDAPADGKGGKAVGLMTTVLVAGQPLETHVFLSLLNHLPIYVMAGDQLWSVDGAQVGKVSAPSN